MEPKIRAIDEAHKGRYGYRRITAALCNSMAEPVNHKCVQRLMQKMGLRAVIRAKRRAKPVSGMSDVQVPNVLERELSVFLCVRRLGELVLDCFIVFWPLPGRRRRPG